MDELKNFEIYRLTPVEFEEFLWGVYHLEPFTSETGRPPMPASQFVLLFQISFGCKLSISKVSKLRRSNIDLEEKVVLIKNNKNGRVVKTPIRNNEYVKLQKYLQGMFHTQKLFPTTENTARIYARDALRMSGLAGSISQIDLNDQKVVYSRKKSSQYRIREGKRVKRPVLKTSSTLFSSYLNLHPKIIEVTKKLFSDGYYSNAIFDAIIVLEQAIRNKSGVTNKIGVNLMNDVFNYNFPILKLNQGITQEQKDEQQGFMDIFRGIVLGIKNPKSHSIVNLTNSSTAVEYLAFISMLMRKVDASTK